MTHRNSLILGADALTTSAAFRNYILDTFSYKIAYS